jgi:hypothetical protein
VLSSLMSGNGAPFLLASIYMHVDWCSIYTCTVVCAQRQHGARKRRGSELSPLFGPFVAFEWCAVLHLCVIFAYAPQQHVDRPTAAVGGSVDPPEAPATLDGVTWMKAAAALVTYTMIGTPIGSDGLAERTT